MDEPQNLYSDDHLLVKQIQPNNKGLFSKKHFHPWDIVLKVQPLAIAVMTGMKDKYCNYCLQPKDLVRCSQCKSVYYCSAECQKEDWQVHKEQCKIYGAMVKEKNLSPLQHITAEFVLNLRLYLIRQKHSTVDANLKEMVNLLDSQTPEKLKYFQQLAVAMMQNLGIERTPENMSNIIKQISTVSINGFTIQDYLCSVDALGPGIYYPANFINHDCHPNCTQIYDGRTLKIVANRPIGPNEEITISYTPALDSYDRKRQICREGYLFECFCEFCQVNKMFDWETFYLLCPKCKHKTLVRNKDAESSKSQNQIICKECKVSINESEHRKIMDEIQNLSENVADPGVEYSAAKKSFFAIKKLVDFSSPQFEPLIHRIYIKAIEEGVDNPKMYEQAYILLREMIANMPKWFRLDEEEDIPYPYVWKYAEMGKLCYNLNKKKKAVEYTEKSFEILKKIGINNKLKEVKEMEQRVSELKISMSFEKAEAFRKS